MWQGIVLMLTCDIKGCLIQVSPTNTNSIQKSQIAQVHVPFLSTFFPRFTTDTLKAEV